MKKVSKEHEYGVENCQTWSKQLEEKVLAVNQRLILKWGWEKEVDHFIVFREGEKMKKIRLEIRKWGLILKNYSANCLRTGWRETASGEGRDFNYCGVRWIICPTSVTQCEANPGLFASYVCVWGQTGGLYRYVNGRGRRGEPWREYSGRQFWRHPKKIYMWVPSWRLAVSAVGLLAMIGQCQQLGRNWGACLLLARKRWGSHYDLDSKMS